MKRLKFVVLMMSSLLVTTAMAGPADNNGHSASEAYLYCNAALISQDAAAAWNCISSALKNNRTSTLTPELFNRALPSMSKFAARHVTVDSERHNGNLAIVRVEGDVQNARTGELSHQNGVVALTLEGGIWKIVKERWGL